MAVEILERRMCLSLDVPAFISLPGANHTIYLDFNGHITSGTTWNTGYYGVDPIDSPAWSLDTDRTNFSDTELATIANIARRVAEDFSPFNVNVTTVEPPINDLRKGEVSGDTKWGVRAVVTIETTTVRCGCGGIAYIGSFNDLYDEPVFIYNSSENGVAEAISHEVGHSLNLAHDGTLGADRIKGTSDDVEYYAGHGSGNTSWAPIMGSSYNRSVTSWDRGEYYNTNNGTSSANYSNGPDDLAVITTKNGFGYRGDDHGGTTATATALTVAGTSVSSSGIVTSRTDVDMFSFTTGAGTVALNINPVAIRPNLDIQADLLDAAGNLVASSNPVDSLNASFSLSLAAGTYYLRV
ncbi:MAG TPA: zinc-dependent metalloprotease family protein, partial [Pirellula sp.]|nr:zinc-dependent metalloprotease family protein [Pirellula sp.]